MTNAHVVGKKLTWELTIPRYEMKTIDQQGRDRSWIDQNWEGGDGCRVAHLITVQFGFKSKQLLCVGYECKWPGNNHGAGRLVLFLHTSTNKDSSSPGASAVPFIVTSRLTTALICPLLLNKRRAALKFSNAWVWETPISNTTVGKPAWLWLLLSQSTMSGVFKPIPLNSFRSGAPPTLMLGRSLIASLMTSAHPSCCHVGHRKIRTEFMKSTLKWIVLSGGPLIYSLANLMLFQPWISPSSPFFLSHSKSRSSMFSRRLSSFQGSRITLS